MQWNIFPFLHFRSPFSTGVREKFIGCQPHNGCKIFPPLFSFTSWMKRVAEKIYSHPVNEKSDSHSFRSWEFLKSSGQSYCGTKRLLYQTVFASSNCRNRPKTFFHEVQTPDILRARQKLTLKTPYRSGIFNFSKKIQWSCTIQTAIATSKTQLLKNSGSLVPYRSKKKNLQVQNQDGGLFFFK